MLNNAVQFGSNIYRLFCFFNMGTKIVLTHGIGVMLREDRESCGLTQAELANTINTTKSAISRLEKHAEDIRLSTLNKAAKALGKTLKVSIH
ncbi:hypothetical protein ES705_39588 [subsurface metagenome]